MKKAFDWIKKNKTFSAIAGIFLLFWIGAIAVDIWPGRSAAETLGNELQITPEELVSRTVKSGKKEYNPGYGIGIRPRDNGWTIGVRFDSSDWYDPADYFPKADQEDMMKAGGHSYFSTWPWKWGTLDKSKCSALFAWRCVVGEPYTWEAAGYTNECDGTHHIAEPIKFRAGDFVLMDYDLFNGLATFEMWITTYTGKRPVTRYMGSWALPIDVHGWQMNVDPYHGGTPPAPIDHSIQSLLKGK